MGRVIATGTQSCAPSTNKHFTLLISLVSLALHVEMVSEVQGFGLLSYQR